MSILNISPCYADSESFNGNGGSISGLIISAIILTGIATASVIWRSMSKKPEHDQLFSIKVQQGTELESSVKLEIKNQLDTKLADPFSNLFLSEENAQELLQGHSLSNTIIQPSSVTSLTFPKYAHSVDGINELFPKAADMPNFVADLFLKLQLDFSTQFAIAEVLENPVGVALVASALLGKYHNSLSNDSRVLPMIRQQYTTFFRQRNLPRPGQNALISDINLRFHTFLSTIRMNSYTIQKLDVQNKTLVARITALEQNLKEKGLLQKEVASLTEGLIINDEDLYAILDTRNVATSVSSLPEPEPVLSNNHESQTDRESALGVNIRRTLTAINEISPAPSKELAPTEQKSTSSGLVNENDILTPEGLSAEARKTKVEHWLKLYADYLV
jgi:hypothetical protein